MNIGIVTTWFERGAAYVSRAYMETLRQKHNVFIYARGGEQYAQRDPLWDAPYVTWAKRPQSTRPTFIDRADFRTWIARNKLDAILFNEQHSWDIILTCRRECNVRLGAYVDYYTAETVPLFGLYDFLLCNTKRHYSVFNSHPKCLYLPWGTDLSLFAPGAPPLERGPVRFFHSCGLDPVRKGTVEAVRAFGRITGPAQLILHSQNAIKDAWLQEQIAQNPNIEARVEEVGAPGLYYLGDVYVYPTRLEGIGLTIAEALACGLPVITTDNAPMSEFVTDDHAGRLVRVKEFLPRWDGYYWPESPCDERSLQEAMQFYVDRAREIPHFRTQARAHAEKYLDWRQNSAPLLPFLDELMSEERPPLNRDLMRAAAAYERKKTVPAWKETLARLGAAKVKKALLRRGN